MELTKIYMDKVFLRLKNKTQLCSALADDHYHTRLVHSLEVASIAESIAEKLPENFEIDKMAVIKGALLHDIGHTPFGHAGERTLHDILSGNDTCFNLVCGIKDKNLAQGFKHNINSGLLYKESTPYSKVEYKVMDAIIKHTKIQYKSSINERLDYGFERVVNGIDMLKDNYYNDYPKYIEGYIVATADEIAQICSNYLDIIRFDDTYEQKIKDTELIEELNEAGKITPISRLQVEYICIHLICEFVKELQSKSKDDFLLNQNNSHFWRLINSISNINTSIIKENTSIKLFDESKRTIIETLFAYYFITPEALETKTIKSIVFALQDTNGLSADHYNEINVLTDMNDSEQFREKAIALIKNSINIIFNSVIKGNEKKRNETIVKVFLRYIAVHISKMTDNYASQKYKKIVNGKTFLKNI